MTITYSAPGVRVGSRRAVLLAVCSFSLTFQPLAADDAVRTGSPGAGQTASDSAETQENPSQDSLTPEAADAARELTTQLAEGSEARAMLNDILQGSRLGPGEGWFAESAGQTLYGWEYVTEVYDHNEDAKVSSEEFAGDPSEFSRIDRNADALLTEADFDWSEHSLTRTPGVMLFFMADRDGNGKLTQQEILDLFRSLDSGAHGFLSLDDVRDQFQPPDAESASRQRARRSDQPDRSTLVLGLQRQEIGSLQSGPNVGDMAPDFQLNTLDGAAVRLSKQTGEQPVVLIFGNFTCGPFRSQAGNLEKLYERYRDRAKFYLVYVREAHPSDGWWMTSNKRIGIDVRQPGSDAARIEVAQACRGHLELEIPFLVDSVDDTVGAAWSGMPNRLYIIDREGRIVFKNGRGPFGFHPRQLEQALVLLLNDHGTRDSDSDLDPDR